MLVIMAFMLSGCDHTTASAVCCQELETFPSAHTSAMEFCPSSCLAPEVTYKLSLNNKQKFCIVLAILLLPALTLKGCEQDEENTSMFGNFVVALAIYGFASGCWTLCKTVSYCTRMIQSEHPEVAGQPQAVWTSSKSNPADKLSKGEVNQPTKKVSKKKIEKFLEKLTVDILKEVLRKFHVETTGLKKDLIARVVTAIEDVKIE